MKLIVFPVEHLRLPVPQSRQVIRFAGQRGSRLCIGAHGTLLSAPAWRALLNVLFPMLQQVQKQSNIASSEKVDTGEHILIHHTRNTAQKQWAETQCFTPASSC
ncbi:unnamed protein product [Leptidea sinapis]|uniref:Mon2 C-terminal domain-containing protein n=1 Tax=Leptidea sinapis TaxID=189913 RepID=A0A5E4R8N6_9NEOP|nr:unnamed protein product [Leptidea sinapis]